MSPREWLDENINKVAEWRGVTVDVAILDAFCAYFCRAGGCDSFFPTRKEATNLIKKYNEKRSGEPGPKGTEENHGEE